MNQKQSPSLPIFIATLLALAAPLAHAAAQGTVEAVQAPAWLERDGRSQPLNPGTEVKSGDVVRTGSGSRAYLMLAEGSRVKLGESAEFKIQFADPEPKSIFRGAFDVVKGAFRFTTGLLAKSRPREVTIRVATATIGIRGTDVWGRAGPDSELVALIEGKIELQRAGQVFQLAPMNYMEARRGEPATVQRVDFAALQKLAAETEITQSGAMRSDGKWQLTYDAGNEQSQAISLYDRLRAAGYATRIRPLAAATTDSTGSGFRYLLHMNGFASSAEAELVADRVQKAVGVKFAAKRLG